MCSVLKTWWCVRQSDNFFLGNEIKIGGKQQQRTSTSNETLPTSKDDFTAWGAESAAVSKPAQVIFPLFLRQSFFLRKHTEDLLLFRANKKWKTHLNGFTLLLSFPIIFDSFGRPAGCLSVNHRVMD